MTVVQVSVEKADKEKHSDSQDAEKDSEEEVLMMKNNESDEYSETAEVTDEKRSQITEHLTSYHAGDHAAEEPDHHDDEHEGKQEHVVHIVSIMFNRADNDDCPASVVKR